MKKRFLILMLSVLILSGCAKSAPPPEQPAGSQSGAQSAEPLPREILEYETENLPIYLSGSDRLLAVLEKVEDGNTKLVTLDLSNGKVMAHRKMEEDYPDLLVFSEGVAIRSWEQQTLQVYSDTLEPLWSMEFEPEESVQMYGDDLFYIPKKGGEVRKVSLLDRNVLTCQCAENISSMEILLTQGGRNLIRTQNADTGELVHHWIDWDAGTLEPVPLSDRYMYMTRNFYYDLFPGEKSTWLRSAASDDIYKIEDKIDWFHQNQPEILVGENSAHMLTVLKPKENRSIQRKTAGIEEALFCGDSVVYREKDRPGVITIWNPSPEQWKENTAQRMTTQEVSRENQEMVQAITDRTGIPVFYGAEGASYQIGFEGGYHSEPITDELLIHISLEQLQRFTDECPEGLFQEMCTEKFSPIEIYLGGTIRGSLYGMQPYGFTTFNEKAQIVVLDIVNHFDMNALRGTIAHEFLHVMENRINAHGLDTGLEYTDYWMSFVPDPDLYFYNYRDYQDYDKHPEEYTVSGTQTPLFLDSYSRTLPTEDRARMFEYLYLGETSEYYSRLRTGVLREKAEYLCAVIRECFTTCQIQGRLPWENGIDIVPFSEFEDAVRSYVPVALG